ncbi:MAG: phosphotransferase [Betaproteobacteria bacterium]|nr:phosphotransferase [Betaproteobacteria bacterium]
MADLPPAPADRTQPAPLPETPAGIESLDAGGAADARLQAICTWLATAPAGLHADAATLQPASSDASFRRYFRVHTQKPLATTLIVMDAPPGREDIEPFLRVATLLRAGGLSAPKILASSVELGLVLLSDFGSTTYLKALQAARAEGNLPRCDALMRDALTALVRLQGIGAPDLPLYDASRLRAELELFPQWYVTRHVGAELSVAERNALQGVFDALLANNLAQPCVLVHRDYHSRNLMVLEADQDLGNPGVLDFQDAVRGPITYDLVSLLRDAYISWPEEQQLDWAIRWWEQARKAGLPVDTDFSVFYRDFEWMGLQRHLKVLGIFARLFYRDGKADYLAELPTVMGYVRAVAARYREFAPLLRLLDRLQGLAVQTAYTF